MGDFFAKTLSQSMNVFALHRLKGHISNSDQQTIGKYGEWLLGSFTSNTFLGNSSGTFSLVSYRSKIMMGRNPSTSPCLHGRKNLYSAAKGVV